MAQYTARAQGKTKTKSKPCKPEPQACGDCGALKCVCRPRFFAGQLLTEQDLNRLSDYIREKNRLHNRHLIGWGVVNGLQVSCGPCDNVTVGCGYAVGPCGDDIVVCGEEEVDICDLIRKCREKERGEWECKPTAGKADGGCGDVIEEWVLAIRYAEWPTRGITALSGGGCESGAGCSCGGGGAGGCSCGGSVSGRGKTQSCGSSGSKKPRGASAQCEPTVICEGYAFEAFRKPQEGDDNRKKFAIEGDLVERFKCCWEPFQEAIIATPGEGNRQEYMANSEAWYLWCCRMRDSLTRYFASHSHYNCQFDEVLASLKCPSPEMPKEAFADAMETAAAQLGLIMIETMLACLCSALLPPCPDGNDDPRVPLATVKVQGRNCKVISVCNWTTLRPIAVTMPALEYWFGSLPFGRMLREILDYMCCEFLSGFTRVRIPTDYNPTYGQNAQPGAQPPGGPPAPPAGGQPAGQPAQEANVPPQEYYQQQSMLRLNPQLQTAGAFQSQAFVKMGLAGVLKGMDTLDPKAFLSSLTRMKLAGDKEGLSEIEQENLPHFLLMNQIMKPMGLATLPGGLVKLAGQLLNFGGKAGMETPFDLKAAAAFGAKAKAEAKAEAKPQAAAADVEALSVLVKGMQENLKKQNEEIKILREELKKKGKG